jgi:hypothetical protein
MYRFDVAYLFERRQVAGAVPNAFLKARKSGLGTVTDQVGNLRKGRAGIAELLGRDLHARTGHSHARSNSRSKFCKQTAKARLMKLSLVCAPMRFWWGPARSRTAGAAN